MTERPEDEQREDGQDRPAEEPTAEERPEPSAEERPEPTAEERPEPTAEERPEPTAEERPEPIAEEQPEPVAEEQPESVAEERTGPAAEASREPAAREDAAVIEAAQSRIEDEELIEDEIALVPRQKPEIPGADLVPDIIPEGDQFLDAEAQAAADAEAEAQAAARRQEEDDEDEARPIADAAIDLAAGARYTATGKRKTAVARVILKPGTGNYLINGKPLETFFPRETLRRVIRQPLESVGYESRMDVVARMHGGGVSAQAGALRHGISRALIVADPNLRGELKRRGFLTRDPRVKERKKAGLKKARKRPQFSKR